MSSHLVMKQTCRWHSRCYGDGMSVSLLCGCWFRNTAYILHPVKRASGIEGAKHSLLWKMMQCAIKWGSPRLHQWHMRCSISSTASKFFKGAKRSTIKFLQISQRGIFFLNNSKQEVFFYLHLVKTEADLKRNRPCVWLQVCVSLATLIIFIAPCVVQRSCPINVFMRP